MALTRRQKWRIEKIQAERLARASKSANKPCSSENLKNEQTGLVITRYGLHLLVEGKSGKLYKCTGRQNIKLAVAGDKVIFQTIDNDKGIVTALVKRNNELKRTDKIIAANVDQLWLVVALEPHYEFELIDRYLILAENIGLKINILVNKIELENNIDKLQNDFSIYENIGYKIIYLSVKKQINIDKLRKLLNNKTHIFLGQSGVGKSSLASALIPDLNLRTNELSIKTKLGKHTTTNTTLYHIPSGGNLLDSPGIREFQLDDLSNQEILNGFKEFKQFIGKCRFRNCKHINEPNCAIKQAVDLKKIHPSRYKSYLDILAQ